MCTVDGRFPRRPPSSGRPDFGDHWRLDEEAFLCYNSVVLMIISILSHYRQVYNLLHGNVSYLPLVYCSSHYRSALIIVAWSSGSCLIFCSSSCLPAVNMSFIASCILVLWIVVIILGLPVSILNCSGVQPSGSVPSLATVLSISWSMTSSFFSLNVSYFCLLSFVRISGLALPVARASVMQATSDSSTNSHCMSRFTILRLFMSSLALSSWSWPHWLLSRSHG